MGGKGFTIVDDWAVGGWTLLVGSYVHVSACACNVRADWREGEGYGESPEEAAVALREREVLELSRASCLVDTSGGRLDRWGANEEILRSRCGKGGEP